MKRGGDPDDAAVTFPSEVGRYVTEVFDSGPEVELHLQAVGYGGFCAEDLGQLFWSRTPDALPRYLDAQIASAGETGNDPTPLLDDDAEATEVRE